MLTKNDLDKIRKIVEEKIDSTINNLLTKDEFYEKMDEVMGELKAIREEQTVFSAKVSNHSDQLEDHEARIINLEAKVATT